VQHFADKHSTLKKSATSMPGIIPSSAPEENPLRVERVQLFAGQCPSERCRASRSCRPSRRNITPSTIAEIVAHRVAVLKSRNPRSVAPHSRHTLRECRRCEAHSRGGGDRHRVMITGTSLVISCSFLGEPPTDY
jgi:hypothetical protein